MIVNAEDLNGAALDWMIAKFMKNELLMDGIREGLSGAVSPSTDWSVGGPIISPRRWSSVIALTTGNGLPSTSAFARI